MTRTVTVSILGRNYEVPERSKEEDPVLKTEDIDGYCDESVALVVVDAMERSEVDSLKDLGNHKKKVMRHELIHAFLSESGLKGECYWASEEMIDWVAYQFPKMQKAFEEAGCM